MRKNSCKDEYIRRYGKDNWQKVLEYNNKGNHDGEHRKAKRLYDALKYEMNEERREYQYNYSKQDLRMKRMKRRSIDRYHFRKIKEVFEEITSQKLEFDHLWREKSDEYDGVRLVKPIHNRINTESPKTLVWIILPTGEWNETLIPYKVCEVRPYRRRGEKRR